MSNGAITAAPSTSAGQPGQSVANTRGEIGAGLLILVAWLGTYFPWVAASTTAFSVNLYDLAEWSSLNPVVRGGAFPLLATFLLRAVVGLLAFRLTLQAASNPIRVLCWAIRALALLIGIGLLPPFDFFRGAFDDPNYRQQFIMALVSCIAILAAWRVREDRIGPSLFKLLTVLPIGLALAFSLLGLALGLQALGMLGLRVSYGLGAVLTIVGEGLLILVTVF